MGRNAEKPSLSSSILICRRISNPTNCQILVCEWFGNGLGSLPVFPVPLATSALDHAIRYESQNWISNSQAFAFALPVRQGRVTEKQLKIYGSKLARNIFQGGGPFMLEDSSDLVAHFLHKLGYLDETWNSDFTEALNGFWNASSCKAENGIIV